MEWTTAKDVRCPKCNGDGVARKTYMVHGHPKQRREPGTVCNACHGTGHCDWKVPVQKLDWITAFGDEGAALNWANGKYDSEPSELPVGPVTVLVRGVIRAHPDRWEYFVVTMERFERKLHIGNIRQFWIVDYPDAPRRGEAARIYNSRRRRVVA